jgi:hypothetical protein
MASRSRSSPWRDSIRGLREAIASGLVAAAISSAAASPSAAQAPVAEAKGESPARPVYQPYRYDEDWSALEDSRLRTDLFDPVKFVPLKDTTGWYLSVGGETRWRYEHFRNPGFGTQPADDNGYLLQRHLLHTDWHLGPRARVFIEIQSGLEEGRAGGPRPTDEDRLDVHQAFADITWGNPSRGSLTVRAGRHEVAFGAGRLISAAEGLNVRRSFDGVRLIGRRKGWTANATLMRLVSAQGGMFDDRADGQQLTWGAGGFGPLPGGRRGNLALYYIGMERDSARFDQGTARAVRHSVGVRTWRVGRFVDYDEEAIVQRGQFGSSAIRAWAFASEQGMTPPRVSGRARIGLRAFFASGDRDPKDPTLQSFDPLFPGISYSGRAVLIGPTNLITVDPSFAISVDPRVRVTFDWAQFWRASLHDGVYGINVALLRSGLDAAERGVGSQATIEVDARLSMHFSLWGSITAFQTGRFLRNNPPGADLQYVAAHAAYRF